MINKTNSNPYVEHINNRKNIQVPKDYSYNSYSDKPQKKHLDIFYILDLSGLKKENEEDSYDSDESAVILDLTEEKEKGIGFIAFDENERAQAVEEEGESPRPSDETRKLTRRLVNAKKQDEVQAVLTDAYDHMREWQALAASGDKEAMKVVRKISRLIARGNRKIKDLHKEIVMHQRQQKAEEQEKKREAKRLEIELKEALRERKARERRYLQERDDNNEEEESEFGPTMAETEAKIRQLAGAMAALKAGVADVGSTGSLDVMPDMGGGDIGGDIGGGGAGEAGGSEEASENIV